MSQDNPPDLNNGIMKFMSRIFAPMPKEDFSEYASQFAIENPLTAEAFHMDEDGDTPFDEINKVQDLLSDGFHPGLATLTHDQWMRTATLLVAAVIDGLRSSCPDNHSPTPFADLNPDETNSLHVLGKAIGALERYFTDPLAENPSEWQQCLRCLKVNHIEVTPEHWQAQLLTCGQMTEAAMSSILNKYARDFDKEVMEWVHEKCAFAFDQVIEVVVNTNPPPFEADPRITEYIQRKAVDLKTWAEEQAMTIGKRKATTLYEQTRVTTLKNFDVDLANIRNDCDQRLQAARDKARLDIAAVEAECQQRLQDAKDKASQDVTILRAELKAQREARKATTHDTLVESVRTTARKKTHEAKRPKPIRTSSKAPSEGSDMGNTHVSETDYGEPSALTQEAMMAVDLANPIADPMAEGNSPTPKADVPLVPAPAAPQLTDMMEFMKDCMEEQSKRLGQQLEPIIARIQRLEQPDVRAQIPDYTEDAYNTWMVPHAEDNQPGYQPHGDLEYEDIPPARIDDDAFMVDYAEHDRQLAAQFDARELEEEEYHTRVKMGLAPTDDDIRAAGGDDARVKANELARIACRAEYLRSTQSRTDANQSQTGLRASQPITIESTPPKPKSFAAAATTAPKAGSVWMVVGKKINPRPRQQPPTQPAAGNTTAPKPYTIDKLSAHRTTKTDIINHAHATFGIQLSDKMRKPQLIAAYQQLASNPKLTNPPTNNPPPNQQGGRNTQRQAAPRPFTSEWTIRRSPGTEAIDFRRPFNGDPLALVRHIQSSLRQHSAEAEPPLTLVAGRWSVGLTSNFVLTFAGKPHSDLVENYKGALLDKFPAGLFNLIRNDGLRKFIVNGVPCVRKPNGRLPMALELFEEFQRNNAHIRQWDLPEHPTWTRGALADVTKTETSFTFLLSISPNATNHILRVPCYMYGKACTVKLATSYVQHRQCTRCYLLTHNTDTCPHDPTTYKRCGICGKSGHLQSEHNSGHCGKNHLSIPCNCPPRCFNCFFTKKPAAGHYAFSDECPLKKNMCRYNSEPAATSTSRPRNLPTTSTLVQPTKTDGPLATLSAHQPAHPAPVVMDCVHDITLSKFQVESPTSKPRDKTSM
jgi:hypothetical protein